MTLGQAIRRALVLCFLLGIIGLLTFGVKGVAAQDGGGGRSKTVELKVTQVVWQLVSRSSGRVLCEVLVEHEGFPTNVEAVNLCSAQIYGVKPQPTAGLSNTPVPTPELVDLNDLLKTAYWSKVETREFTRTVTIPLPDMIVSINPPPGPVAQAYVLLNAYEPVQEYKIVGIFGTVNNTPFQCTSSPCMVPLPGDSVVVFWARSSFGDESAKVRAEVRVARTEQGFTVTITSVTPFRFFSDSCAQAWGLGTFSLPKWAEFPSSPEQLNTSRPLYFLAAKLISVGLVDAKDCPGGGLLSAGSPNACGLERANSAMIQWQNQFDPIIWSTGQNQGIPPKLIKTLISRESQFWPGNALNFIYEYGLGQMNQIGADVALRYDNDLYTRVCEGVLFDCSVPYASQPSWLQATVRGALIRSINAECPTCAYGVDLSAAQQSIPVMTQVLRSNCYQVKFITDLMNASAGYEDMWKFTLASYHGGYQCLFDSMNSAKKANETLNWENVSARMNCQGSSGYVDTLWDELTTFDNYRLKPGQGPGQPPAVQPTFVPTATAIPSPTPVPSRATIRVLVFIDSNNNNLPDPGELVSGLDAQVAFPDGSTQVKRVTNGEAIFDMTGKPIGTVVTVSLPSLFRSTLVRLPEAGQLPVIFRLEQPPLPTRLP